MFTITVANLKGGTGKTTLATHLAARQARLGERVVLLDLDRQRGASEWVRRRPESLPAIEALHQDPDELQPPRGSGVTVVDVPAGLRKKEIEAVVKVADVVVVPVAASVFDEAGTARFLAVVEELKPVRRGRRPVAVVGWRVKGRSVAARQLDAFLEGLAFPAVARIGEGQHYVRAAADGVTLFDQPPGRVRAALAEWQPLLAFLDVLRAE